MGSIQSVFTVRLPRLIRRRRLKRSGPTPASGRRVRGGGGGGGLVLSMAATIHLIFKSKHMSIHSLGLLARQLPPPQDPCAGLSECSLEIGVPDY